MAETVIDSLVVELSLHRKDFERGVNEIKDGFKKLTEQLVEHGKRLEGQTKKAAESVSTLSREFQGLFSLLVGGFSARALTSFTENLTKMDSALGRFAQNIGVSPQSIGAWGLAVERMGGDAKAAEASFQGLYDKVWRLTNLGETMPTSFWLGLSRGGVSQQFLASKDTYERMLLIAQALQNIAAGPGGRPEAAGFGRNAFGLDEGTINTILARGPEFRQHIESLRGLAPTDEQIAKFQKLLAVWTELEQRAVSFGRTLISELLDPLTKTLEAVNKISISSYLQSIGKDQPSWLGRQFQSLFGGSEQDIQQDLSFRVTGESGGLLGSVADAIQKQEGWAPGSRSFRNNNPGNIKFGALAARYGATGADDGGHAIFPDYASGRAALEALLRSHSGESLSQLGKSYAEDPGWARGVGKAGGFDINSPLNLSGLNGGQLSAAYNNQSYDNSTRTNTQTTIGAVNFNMPGVADGHQFGRDVLPYLNQWSYGVIANDGAR